MERTPPGAESAGRGPSAHACAERPPLGTRRKRGSRISGWPRGFRFRVLGGRVTSVGRWARSAAMEKLRRVLSGQDDEEQGLTAQVGAGPGSGWVLGPEEGAWPGRCGARRGAWPGVGAGPGGGGAGPGGGCGRLRLRPGFGGVRRLAGTRPPRPVRGARLLPVCLEQPSPAPPGFLRLRRARGAERRRGCRPPTPASCRGPDPHAARPPARLRASGSRVLRRAPPAGRRAGAADGVLGPPPHGARAVTSASGELKPERNRLPRASGAAC